MDSRDDNYGAQLFNFFGTCLQHKSKIKWDEVVMDFSKDERSDDTLKEAIHKYLERFANIKNLGGAIIRKIFLRTKSAAIKFNGYLARRQEWVRHIKGGYMNKGLALPTQQGLVE